MNQKRQNYLGFVLLIQLLLFCAHSIISGVVGAYLGKTASLTASCITVCAVFALPILYYCKKSGVHLTELLRPKTANDRTRNSQNTVLLFIFAVCMTVTAVNTVGALCDLVLSFFTSVQGTENLTAPQLILVFLRNVLLASVLEEALFRGVILNATDNADIKKRILLSSFIFALAHYSLRAFFYAFAAGIILAYFALKVGSVAFTVAVHFTQNLITFIFTVLRQFLSDSIFDTASLIVFLVLAAVAIIGTVYLFLNKKSRLIAPVSKETQKCDTKLFSGELIAYTILATVLSILIF